MGSTVQVDIHGQRYAVRSELDPHYVNELAAFVDEKMQAVARELASADPVRIAVIAALNISDELWRARSDSQGNEGRLHAKAAEIEQIIDKVLAAAQQPRLVVNE